MLCHHLFTPQPTSRCLTLRCWHTHCMDMSCSLNLCHSLLASPKPFMGIGTSSRNTVNTTVRKSVLPVMPTTKMMARPQGGRGPTQGPPVCTLVFFLHVLGRWQPWPCTHDSRPRALRCRMHAWLLAKHGEHGGPAAHFDPRPRPWAGGAAAGAAGPPGHPSEDPPRTPAPTDLALPGQHAAAQGGRAGLLRPLHLPGDCRR